MKTIYFKHTGLPVPDLFIKYEIDEANRIVRIDLGHHLDSFLLIDFVRSVLAPEECIHVIDNCSHSTFGPTRIEGQFNLEVCLAGQWFDVCVVQLLPMLFKEGAGPQFTISMSVKGVNPFTGKPLVGGS